MKKNSTSQAIAIAVALFTVAAFAPVLFSFAALNPFNSLTQQLDRNSSEYAAALLSHEVVQLAGTDGGFMMTDVALGSGAMAQDGDVLYVHYVGMLEDGSVFDTSTENEEPFAFVLGSQQVIQGWEVGLRGMSVGGTRHLVIPAALAYGSQQINDSDGNVVVPANATLVFDVILMGIDKAQ